MENRKFGPKPLDFSQAKAVKKYLLAESCGRASPLPFEPKNARIGCVACVLVFLQARGLFLECPCATITIYSEIP
ncbi:hypothetical protein L596_012897 [Steinernema carpocapsae]|uniref:Uncharacterized protein n=1 Tax=Steinernema carpocapsae TaxID=34508 RepID=A0A4U5NZB6_STECR|nr:hypothetical protein L596_012897 [Steinernema carpocapsae]